MAQSTNQELLTIAELARSLNLPESTTRYYCNRFAANLPSVGEGRRRRFKPKALQILRTIAETMRRNKNAYAVDLALRNGDCAPPANTPAPLEALPTVLPQEQIFAPTAAFAGQVLSLMENQTKALQEIASAMTVFAERLAPPPPAPAAAPQATDNAATQKELAALREQIRASEAVHQNDLEQLRKWLTRLGEVVANK